MIRKLGLILECDSGGPDQTVLQCFVRRLSPDTLVVAKPQGSKRAVYLNAADVARQLVEVDECDLVLIVWDQKPLWKDAEKEIVAKNCSDERDLMLDCLKGLPKKVMSQVRLLCISAELETWLMADAAVIREYLSTGPHKCKWKGTSYDPNGDAKSELISLSIRQRGPGRRYSDFFEAIRIARLIKSTRNLRTIPSFKRFVHLLTGDPNREFLHDGSVCDNLCHQTAMKRR
jgi:hypothetical protein